MGAPSEESLSSPNLGPPFWFSGRCADSFHGESFEDFCMGELNGNANE